MNDSVLKAREQKINIISQLFFHAKSVISVQANIPGKDKNKFESYFLTSYFNGLLKQSIPTKSYFFESDNGPYYLVESSINDNISLKNKLIEIEENHPIGRYIDLDLFVDKNKSLSRHELNLPLRTCFLCHEPAFLCSRSKNHELSELLNKLESDVNTFILQGVKEFIEESAFAELELEDKYGLVTKTTSGSHDDMNYQLMKRAINSLIPYFLEMFIVGMNTELLDDVLDKVRQTAIEYEKKMYLETNNVNCYKGLIYVFGITLIATGYTLKNRQSFKNIFSNIKIIASNNMTELNTTNYASFGTTAYKNFGIKGVRGEVYNGLPAVQLSIHHLDKTIDYDTLHHTLNSLINFCDDTVLLKRCVHPETYQEVKKMVLSLKGKRDFQEFTKYCIEKKYSFGGSADLLVVTVFLRKIRHFFKEG